MAALSGGLAGTCPEELEVSWGRILLLQGGSGLSEVLFSALL